MSWLCPVAVVDAGGSLAWVESVAQTTFRGHWSIEDVDEQLEPVRRCFRQFVQAEQDEGWVCVDGGCEIGENRGRRDVERPGAKARSIVSSDATCSRLYLRVVEQSFEERLRSCHSE